MSKFGDILKQAKERPQDVQDATPATPATAVGHSPAPPESPSQRGPGRPKTGKRSDPAFEQVSAYVPKALYRDIRIRLLAEDKGREFSGLVAELLAGWLKDQPRG